MNQYGPAIARPTKEVAIFWDYENVQIPSRCTSPLQACMAISKAAAKHGVIQQRRVYADYSREDSTNMSRLGADISESGFDLVSTPRRAAKKKETLDRKMINDIIFFAWDVLFRGGEPCVILITSDGDFAYTINKLRDRGASNVVMHGSNVSSLLIESADIALNLEEDVLPDHILRSSALATAKNSPRDASPTPLPSEKEIDTTLHATETTHVPVSLPMSINSQGIQVTVPTEESIRHDIDGEQSLGSQSSAPTLTNTNSHYTMTSSETETVPLRGYDVCSERNEKVWSKTVSEDSNSVDKMKESSSASTEDDCSYTKIHRAQDAVALCNALHRSAGLEDWALGGTVGVEFRQALRNMASIPVDPKIRYRSAKSVAISEEWIFQGRQKVRSDGTHGEIVCIPSFLSNLDGFSTHYYLKLTAKGIAQLPECHNRRTDVAPLKLDKPLSIKQPADVEDNYGDERRERIDPTVCGAPAVNSSHDARSQDNSEGSQVGSSRAGASDDLVSLPSSCSSGDERTKPTIDEVTDIQSVKDEACVDKDCSNSSSSRSTSPRLVQKGVMSMSGPDKAHLDAITLCKALETSAGLGWQPGSQAGEQFRKFVASMEQTANCDKNRFRKAKTKAISEGWVLQGRRKLLPDGSNDGEIIYTPSALSNLKDFSLADYLKLSTSGRERLISDPQPAALLKPSESANDGACLATDLSVLKKTGVFTDVTACVFIKNVPTKVNVFELAQFVEAQFGFTVLQACGKMLPHGSPFYFVHMILGSSNEAASLLGFAASQKFEIHGRKMTATYDRWPADGTSADLDGGLFYKRGGPYHYSGRSKQTELYVENLPNGTDIRRFVQFLELRFAIVVKRAMITDSWKPSDVFWNAHILMSSIADGLKLLQCGKKEKDLTSGLFYNGRFVWVKLNARSPRWDSLRMESSYTCYSAS